MTPSQAAKIIGITAAQVRWLIRQGKLPAKRRETRNNQYGHEYSITRREAEHYRDHRPKRGPKPKEGAN